MSDELTGQVAASAAEVYERFFVPALFAEWAPRVLDAAGVRGGERLLDAACGTGVLARAARARGAEVTGLDRNPGMLAVARRTDATIAWVEGMAEDLPFADDAFDIVVSQFGLMFFEDRPAALAEMMRVLRPGGRLAVAVFAGLDHAPGYAAMVALLRRLFGEDHAAQLMAPYALGDEGVLAGLFAKAGCTDVHISRHEGAARFPSIHAWVETDVKGWTLAEMIDNDQYALLQREAAEALAEFQAPDGTVRFAHPALIATVEKAI